MTCPDCTKEHEYQRNLATLALKVLDQQQLYFRTRTPAALAESKKLEGILRTECNAVLNPSKQGKML